MKRIRNRCARCDACKRVYFKGYYRYWTFRKIYYCATLNKIIDVNDGCEQWCKKEACYDFSAQRFDDVIKDVKKISQYIDEK